MKKQNGLWLFVMEAGLCAAAAVLLRGTAGVDAGIFAFPYMQCEAETHSSQKRTPCHCLSNLL